MKGGPSWNWATTLGWVPNEPQMDRFLRLYQQILQMNQNLNLTRITDIEEYWEKHIWDSLSGISPFLSPPSHSVLKASELSPSESSIPSASLRTVTASTPVIQSVIDIGTGGGFPGIPVAIACSDWRITLLDSTLKKVNCLGQICESLQLNHVNAICDRAESLGANPQFQTTYDLALIRAVGSATVCAEYCMPLLKLQGIAILYRGQWSSAQEGQLTHALTQLGGELINIRAMTTPLHANQRHCIEIKKSAPTPHQYPRRVGMAKLKPL